jgi:hypothetical protein
MTHFSNFVLKFLFSRWTNFADSFFKKKVLQDNFFWKEESLWRLGNFENIAGIALSAHVKNKKRKLGHIYRIELNSPV